MLDMAALNTLGKWDFSFSHVVGFLVTFKYSVPFAEIPVKTYERAPPLSAVLRGMGRLTSPSFTRYSAAL